MKRKFQSQKGFTLVELLIATAVFSTMLLLATSGLIQIGRVYYKGITTTKTQETARSIVAEISDAVQVGSNTNIATNATPGPNGEQAFCVGNIRYSYVLNRQVNAQNNLPLQGRHAVWLDLIRQGSACTAPDLTAATPQDGSTDVTAASLSKRRELLATNMRVSQFSITQPVALSPNLVNISINIIYGDQDLSPGGQCLPNRQGGQFCAQSGLSVFVKKRL